MRTKQNLSELLEIPQMATDQEGLLRGVLQCLHRQQHLHLQSMEIATVIVQTWVVNQAMEIVLVTPVVK